MFFFPFFFSASESLSEQNEVIWFFKDTLLRRGLRRLREKKKRTNSIIWNVNEVSGNKQDVGIAAPLIPWWFGGNSGFRNETVRAAEDAKKKTISNDAYMYIGGGGEVVERVVRGEFPLDVQHFETG